MPTPYPNEFRRDVVAVARRGDQSRTEVARSFGISVSCLTRWLTIADRDDGLLVGKAASGAGGLPVLEPGQVRELLKRNKQLVQENEILRRATAYFARDTLPK